MFCLLHAWREWFGGHEIRSSLVFGMQILWWGRVGKILEFLGALTIVVDLAGPVRMARLERALAQYRYGRVHFFKFDPPEEVGDSDWTLPLIIKQLGIYGAFLAVCAALAILLFKLEFWLWYHVHHSGWGAPWWILIIYLWLFVAVLVFGVYDSLRLGSYFVILAVVLLGTFPSARTGDQLGTRIKWYGLATLAFGFSLDMFAS